MTTRAATWISIVGMVSLFGQFGCEATSPMPEVQSPAGRSFEATWRASREVLRDTGWQIDRIDRRAGLMTTLPMTGQVAGEFWRRDAATGEDLAESSLQTIYRQAIVRVMPVEQTDNYRPDVVIQVSRSNRPTAQVTNMSEAYEMFRASNASRSRMTPGYAVDRPSDPTVLPPDEQLAAQLQIAIERRAERILSRMAEPEMFEVDLSAPQTAPAE